jgi:hypothetical protein
MQDVRGRPTTITEGNAKGSYVSYVIEEDVSSIFSKLYQNLDVPIGLIFTIYFIRGCLQIDLVF